MGVLLCLLTAVIWGYWTLTDSRRVKDMAETYLSRILGGQVRVAKANLSLFEGLRLEGVSVSVDDRDRADSRIFSARTFIVKTTPRALISGRLESTQILAIDPKVHLCENVDERSWNFQRVRPPGREKKDPEKPGKKEPVSLPEVLLRGGVVEISRIERGRHVIVGSLAIDGQLMPAGYDLNRYGFDLESRLPGQPVGPRLQGVLDLDLGGVRASLEDLEFSDGLLAIMPAQVRAWWQAHQIAGRVRVPEFSFSPGGKDAPADFRIAVEVDRVRMSVLPEELMGEKEYARQTRLIKLAGRPETLPLRYWNTTELMQAITPPRAVRLKDVSGRIEFTPDRIRLIRLLGNLEGNRLMIDGEADGYGVDAAGRVRVVGTSLDIPHLPQYLRSLPPAVRRFYGELQPSGVGMLLVDVERKRPKGPVNVEVELIVTDGAFAFHEFRYPLHSVTGSVWFGKDRETGLDRIEMRGLRGKGALGTINEDKGLRLDGWVSPLNKHVGLDLHIRSDDCHLDPDLRNAMPKDARSVVDMFDERDAKGNVVRAAQMHGRFETRITRVRGPGNRLNVNVDIDVARGSGAFEHFAYPLRNLSGKVRIRPNHVELIDVVEQQADARLELAGRVNFGNSQPVDPQLKIRAFRVPIDDRLLDAMPAQQREWLRKVQLRGKLNVDGRIYLEKLAGDWTVDPRRDPLLVTSSEVGFDLAMSLSEGRMWRVGEVDAITDVTAEARLTRTRLELKDARGKRGEAEMTGSGSVAWPKDSPSYSLNVDVLGLRVDDELRQILGAKAADLFARLRPEGQTDLHIAYSGGIAEDDDDGNRDPWQTYKVTLRPRGLSVEPASFPWRVDRIFGEVEATPQRILFKDVSGWHDQTKVMLGGAGPGTEQKGWTLKLATTDIVVDDAFKRALPGALAELFRGLEYTGKLSLDVPTLTYLAAPGGSPDAGSMIEFAGRVGFNDASMDVGVPLAAVHGGVDLKGSVVGGDLATLSGRVDLPSTLIAQRQADDVRVDVLKFPGGWYRFDNLQARFGGGHVSGAVHLHAPPDRPTRVGMALVLKDVDVRELTGDDKDDKLHGRLRGSLNLEMTPSNPSLRRGRGDIELEGRELYKVPAMTGLLQITNLALPSPFNSASASYVVDGNRLTFENIAIRAKDMVMNGSGSVDFGTKAVSLTFVTDNPNWPKIPLIEKVKNQLIQIQVRGTVEEPKVKAKSMTVITTTVDEVLSNGKRDAGGGGRKKR